MAVGAGDGAGAAEGVWLNGGGWGSGRRVNSTCDIEWERDVGLGSITMGFLKAFRRGWELDSFQALVAAEEGSFGVAGRRNVFLLCRSGHL